MRGTWFAVIVGFLGCGCGGQGDIEPNDDHQVGATQQAIFEGACGSMPLAASVAAPGSVVSPDANYGTAACPDAYAVATSVGTSPLVAFARYEGPQLASCSSMVATVVVWKLRSDGSYEDVGGATAAASPQPRPFHGCTFAQPMVTLPGAGIYKILGRATSPAKQRVRVGTQRVYATAQ
jgi:hypothetical protein